MQTIQYIPLSQLRPSPRNVRKTTAGSLNELAASIAAHGLLQNLSVTAVGDFYEVEAGGRRLLALRKLAEADTIPADYAVPCLVLESAAAHEASLAENVVRSAMHPTDEFEAFRKLAEDDGLTVDAIADRFGCKPIHVRRRLKLANVAPALLDQFRDGKIELEQIMALALTDDHAVQVRVWESARHWERDPDELREAITADDLSTSSAVGKFVGVKAYEKAGGQIRRDLFDDKDKGSMSDPQLARDLAQQKLDKLAEKLAGEGWSWVEGRISFDYSDKQAFGRAQNTGTHDKPHYPDEVKANAGAVVTIDHNGNAEYCRGLIRPQDRKQAEKAVGGASKIDGGKKPKEAGAPSFAAVQRLQAEGSAIVRAHVAGNPFAAIALLVTELASRTLYSANWERRTWVFIRREHSGRSYGPASEYLDSDEMAAIEAGWRRKLPSTVGQLLDWAMQQEFAELTRLLAFLVARQIEAVDTAPDQKNGITALAKALSLDLAEQWKPTKEWLTTLPKTVILDMVTDAAGKVAAAEVGKAKGKEQLVDAALTKIPDGWLPKQLRPGKPPKSRKPKATPGKDAAAGDSAGDDEA